MRFAAEWCRQWCRDYSTVSWRRRKETDGDDTRPALVARERKEKDHGAEGQDVGDQGDDEDELGKVSRRPGALEVAAALVEGKAGNGEGKDVALDEGGGDEGPGVDERQLGDERQIGNDDASRLAPLSVANCGAEGRLCNEANEEHAGDGGDIYTRRHGGRIWSIGQCRPGVRWRGLEWCEMDAGSGVVVC